MAIDGEPKDGDFARYIENLTRAGEGSPGRVPAKNEISRRLPGPAPVAAPPAPSSRAEPLSSSPWGKSAPPPSSGRPGAAPSSAPPPNGADAGAASLARRAGQRRVGNILTVAGVLVGWAAARIVFQAMHSPRFSMDELMPAVFLAFFALMLLKAGHRARNPRNTPLGKLPPLKPSSYRKDDSA